MDPQLKLGALYAMSALVFVCTSVSALVFIRMMQSLLSNLKLIKLWRNGLCSGDWVLIIDGSCVIRKIIHASADGFVQVEDTKGQRSGHHISTIYPITATSHGTSN